MPHAHQPPRRDFGVTYDEKRVRAASIEQIDAGTGCHLEADMLARALQQLQRPPGSVVMIENVEWLRAHAVRARAGAELAPT